MTTLKEENKCNFRSFLKTVVYVALRNSIQLSAIIYKMKFKRMYPEQRFDPDKFWFSSFVIDEPSTDDNKCSTWCNWRLSKSVLGM